MPWGPEGVGRCHENTERYRDGSGSTEGRENSMGPLEIEEMSWRAAGSGRNTMEATWCIGGSHWVLEG